MIESRSDALTRLKTFPIFVERATKERTRHPPLPKKWKRLQSIFERAQTFAFFTSTISHLKEQVTSTIYNNNFTSRTLQAKLAQPQSKCLLLFFKSFQGTNPRSFDISLFSRQSPTRLQRLPSHQGPTL
jgi:hypothetical protein